MRRHTPAGSQSETGELCVKGPNVFKEYLNKPEATAKAFDSEGWFRYVTPDWTPVSGGTQDTLQLLLPCGLLVHALA